MIGVDVQFSTLSVESSVPSPVPSSHSPSSSAVSPTVQPMTISSKSMKFQPFNLPNHTVLAASRQKSASRVGRQLNSSTNLAHIIWSQTFLSTALHQPHRPSADRIKLLQFHENRRPAFFARWTKKRSAFFKLSASVMPAFLHFLTLLPHQLGCGRTATPWTRPTAGL